MRRIGVLLLLIAVSHGLLDAAFTVTPSSYEVGAVTNYHFSLVISNLGATVTVIPSTSGIVITLPSQYTPIFSTTPMTCFISVWPDTQSTPSCSLTYLTITISNAFTNSNLTISALQIGVTFEWIINSITNPKYAQTLSAVSGSIRDSSTDVLTFTSTSNIVITPGQSAATLSVSPTTTDSTSTLSVDITPAHSIPADGTLTLTLDLTWADAVFTENIIFSTPTCQGINGTANNLACTYVTTGNIIVTVTNIYSSQSSTQFSFTLHPFTNPPTTKPTGSFTLSTQNSGGLTIDQAVSHSISGVTPTPILNPALHLTETTISANTQAQLQLTITNRLTTGDVFALTTPTEISLATVTDVLFNGQQTSETVLSGTQLTFIIPAQYTNPFPVNITLTNITLPSYAASITNQYTMSITRNTFEICSTSVALPISLSAGSLNGSLTLTTYEAGVSSNYSISLQLEHAISSDSVIEVYFSPSEFTIPTSGMTCQSSLSTNCTVISSDSNTVSVQWAVTTTATSLVLTLNEVTNPSSVGAITSLAVTTRITLNSATHLLDNNPTTATATIIARPMITANFNITAASLVTHTSNTYTLAFTNNNPLPIGAYATVTFPASVTLSSPICNATCLVSPNNSQALLIQQLGPLAAGSTTTVTVDNMVNPISTQTTDPLTLSLFDSSDQLLEYLNSGPTLTMTTPNSLAVTAATNTPTNSATGQLNLTITLTHSLISTAAVVLTLPSGVSCPACTATSLNSSHQEFVFPNTPFTAQQATLILDSLVHYFSLESITISAKVVTNNQLYMYSTGSTTLTNTNPSTPSFSYSFTTTQLSTATDLLLSNISSATSSSNIATLTLTFGTDWDLTSATCTNVGYNCVIASNIVTLTPTSNALTSIIIQSITSPGLSPATSVALATLSASSFIIDQATTISWSTNCQLPCRTCSTGPSLCDSCYTDPVLVQSRVLYFVANWSCVTECDPTYYKNYTTDQCLACSTDCANCYNETFCTSCSNGWFLIAANTSCIELCPNGYFTQGSQCIACTTGLNCYTCSNELNCDSCQGRYLYNSQCLTTCPQNTHTANDFNYTCDPCPTNCSTCTLVNTTVTCTACSSGLLDNDNCVQSCATVNTVPDGLVCSPCNENCLTCQNSPTYCLTCNSSSTWPYFLSNQCYTNCPDTYYNDDSSYSCVKCTGPCQKCLNSSSTACTSCLAGYGLYGTTCQSTCPAEFYLNQTQCQACVSPCLTCQTDTLCFTCEPTHVLISANFTCVTSCPDGYVAINQTCTACSGSCLTCTTLTYCSSCPSDSFLLSGTCYSPCPTGYYPDSNTSLCVQCPVTCTACSNSTECSSCLAGYELQSNNTCLNLCPSGQVPIDSICQACNSTCSTCQSTIDYCTACSGSLLFAWSTNTCHQNCPSSLFHYTSNNTCLTACPQPAYSTTNASTGVRTCFDCPQYCTSCVSGTQCGGCEAGTYSYQNLCYVSCPGAVPFAFNFACQSCNVVDCAICSGTDCQACASGKLLIGSTLCISSCSSLQVYNASTRACDTVDTGGDGSSTNGTTTTATVNNQQIRLSFIPMPYLIGYLIAAIVILLLHLRGKLSALSTLLGLVGPVLFVAVLTGLIVGISSSQFSSTALEIGSYLWVLGLLVCIVAGLVGLRLWITEVDCEKEVVIILGVMYPSAYTLLAANIYRYNSYHTKEHRVFWKRYSLLLKVSILAVVPLVIGSVIIGFSTSDYSIYAFYASIEATILSALLGFMTLAWFWFPPSPPPEQEDDFTGISDKSHDQLQNSLQDPGSMNKIRIIDTKTQIIRPLSADTLPPIRPKTTQEYNAIKAVVKLSPKDIQEGIEKGVFRKQESQVVREMQEEEQASKIDNAQKLNEFLLLKEKERRQRQNIFAEQEEPSLQNSPRQPQIPQRPQMQEVIQQPVQEPLMSPPLRSTPKEPLEQISQKQLEDHSLDNAFDESVEARDIDFRHNIIFEQNDDDEVTFNEDMTSGNRDEEEEEEPAEPFHIDKTPSLGEVKKQPEVSKRLVVEEMDGEDSVDVGQIKVFESKEKIRPMGSKQMSRRVPKQEDIIHADFEEILTVSDGADMLFDEKDFQQIDSTRRIAAPGSDEKVEEDDNEWNRPSEMLKKAGMGFKLGKETNAAPTIPQAPKPRRKRI